MSVGRLRPVGPADITKQTRNFQALKISIRRNLPLPAEDVIGKILKNPTKE